MRRLTVDSRMLGAALLAAVAAMLVFASSRPPATTEVLVVDAPAAAGTRVEALALSERAVSDPTGLVSVADGIPDGAVLAVDVPAGVPLTGAVLAAPGVPASDVIGLELPSAAAVHGALEAGDDVDVLDAASGTVLASEVPVVAVLVEDGSLGRGDIGLLLAVDGELAIRLVQAVSVGDIHLVRRGA